MDDKDPTTESGFSPKIMQRRCKPGGLEDKVSKTESGFSPKNHAKKSKPGSLEDQDPKSKISKINFASWIRGFCRHLCTFVSSFLLKDQDPKTESRFSPKIMQIRCKPGGLEDKDPKLNVDLVPKSCKNTQNQVVWRIRIRKVRFPKLVLHRGLEAFVDICIHLSHPFF